MHAKHICLPYRDRFTALFLMLMPLLLTIRINLIASGFLALWAIGYFLVLRQHHRWTKTTIARAGELSPQKDRILLILGLLAIGLWLGTLAFTLVSFVTPLFHS